MKNITNNAVLILSGLLLAIGAAEAILAFMDIPHNYEPVSRPKQFRFFAEVDKYGTIGYLNKQSTTIRFVYDGNPRAYFGPLNEVNHTINGLGFRAPNKLPKHTERTLRIAFLGDSFTFGEGVHDADTFAMQTQALLQKQFPNVVVQSLNLGVGGYNTFQEAELLRLIAIRMEPDIVVVGYTANDVQPALFAFDKTKKRFVRRPTPLDRLGQTSRQRGFFYDNFRIVRLARDVMNKRSSSKATVDIYRAMYREESPEWQRTRKALGDIAGICRDNGIPCYAVLFPLLVNLDNYPLEREHQKVKEVVEEHGYEVIDLLPELGKLGVPHQDLWVHPTDQHPNEIVHRRVAELLARHITESDFMDRYRH